MRPLLVACRTQSHRRPLFSCARALCGTPGLVPGQLDGLSNSNAWSHFRGTAAPPPSPSGSPPLPVSWGTGGGPERPRGGRAGADGRKEDARERAEQRSKKGSFKCSLVDRPDRNTHVYGYLLLYLLPQNRGKAGSLENPAAAEEEEERERGRRVERKENKTRREGEERKRERRE